MTFPPQLLEDNKSTATLQYFTYTLESYNSTSTHGKRRLVSQPSCPPCNKDSLASSQCISLASSQRLLFTPWNKDFLASSKRIFLAASQQQSPSEQGLARGLATTTLSPPHNNKSLASSLDTFFMKDPSPPRNDDSLPTSQ